MKIKNKPFMELPVSDSRGKISAVPGAGAAGMKAGIFFTLSLHEMIKLPPGSELFVLPRRAAAGYDNKEKCFKKAGPHLAVAAFLPPGYTVTYNSAYMEQGKARLLPLFAYAACALYEGEIYTAAMRVDNSPRHDMRFMDMRLARANAARLKKIFSKNRLIRHLEGCAFSYGCPNAINFFLSRYEAPLPASPACNARCSGCISFQPSKSCPVTQPRIRFVPKPEELAEAALYHIKNVKKPIVSFGQGCEGEPLLAKDVIIKAVRLIRAATSKGVIHMNTNAGDPAAISSLFDAGLNSIRVSMNSAREEYYLKYYRPKGYTFSGVKQSIKAAKDKGGFVSLNYLTMPGFTDLKEESRALKKFIEAHDIDMIQWRNLNYDPIGYFKVLKVRPRLNDMFGVEEAINSIKKEFPALRSGYFNPYPPSHSTLNRRNASANVTPKRVGV